MQILKNGEKTLKLRRSYTCASKSGLILHFLKMNLGSGNLWDHLRYILSHTCLENRFRLSIVSFDKCQDCGR